jgi:hypothetical protein
MTQTRQAKPVPSTATDRIDRVGKLTWHRLGDLKPSPVAQRNKLNQSRVEHLRANLDLEQIGYLTVNERDGNVYLIDGWHRCEALLQFGFEPETLIECETYAGLTEQEEAERFLKLNDRLAVHALDQFRMAVAAGRPTEVAVDQLVRRADLQIGWDGNQVRAVAKLVKVYQTAGAVGLAKTLTIIRDAYGIRGFVAVVIDGVGMLVARYGDRVDETATKKLGSEYGGVGGLLNQAAVIQRTVGGRKGVAVAAAAVEIINRGAARGKKLPSWWREES